MIFTIFVIILLCILLTCSRTLVLTECFSLRSLRVGCAPVFRTRHTRRSTMWLVSPLVNSNRVPGAPYSLPGPHPEGITTTVLLSKGIALPTPPAARSVKVSWHLRLLFLL